MTSGDPAPLVRVERLTPGHWARFRNIRIEMLEDEPTAFLEVARDARALADSDWRRRADELAAADAAAFWAMAGGDALGFAAVAEDDDAVALIHAMYVRPGARGAGIGGRLIEAALTWAAARGHEQCALWVREDNHRARRLYERCGFRSSGARRAYRFDASFTEFELRRACRSRSRDQARSTFH